MEVADDERVTAAPAALGDGRSDDERVTAAPAALGEGRWADARAGFEAALAIGETAEACFGLATALWWQGENQACVAHATRAYALFRQAGDDVAAAQCAVWLAITYKANFANFVAANGWCARADRLLAPLDPGAPHGWLWIARAYRDDDLETAEVLTQRAADLAQRTGDVDLELVALSQLGLIGVARGEAAGFTLIDEAVAAALAGEQTRLDTVVYACCDMLNACELATDMERAAQWCKVADEFVATYGCPFLYAECRINYGSVLAATGRWDEAERELRTGVRITRGACPGLHARALVRLAALRVRQGRYEEAEHLLAHLGDGVRPDPEEALSVAALLLARGDAPAAGRHLHQRFHQLEAHHAHLAAALTVLVDAHLAAGAVDDADAAARRLAALASSTHAPSHEAMAAGAAGRVAMARHDRDTAAPQLAAALDRWCRLALPFEEACTRVDLARVIASHQPDVAVEHARRALATFAALGARAEADRTTALLRSLGVRVHPGARATGLLTPREQDVLRLLGAGLSNPEIGRRLHVSRKTASHHVSRILAKLDLRNRAEAAAYATAHDDAGGE